MEKSAGQLNADNSTQSSERQDKLGLRQLSSKTTQHQKNIMDFYNRIKINLLMIKTLNSEHFSSNNANEKTL